jgi:ankyrin repeat protein
MASLEIVKLLVESGANINSSDINAITPLHVAINRKNDQICDYLIEAGAFINVIDKYVNILKKGHCFKRNN